MYIQQDRAPNFRGRTKKDGWEFIQNEGGRREKFAIWTTKVSSDRESNFIYSWAKNNEV